MNDDATAAASWLRRLQRAEIQSKPPEPGRDFALIQTGAPGSGKTTGLSRPLEGSAVGVKDEAILVNYEGARQLVQGWLDAERKPVVVWTYVDDPGKLMDRMLARQRACGRAVHLDYQARAYAVIPHVLEGLKNEFGDKIWLRVVDNSGERGQERMLSQGEASEALRAAKAWDYSKTKERLHDQLESRQRADGETAEFRAAYDYVRSPHPSHIGEDKESGRDSRHDRAAAGGSGERPLLRAPGRGSRRVVSLAASARPNSQDEIADEIVRRQVEAVNAYFREHPDAEVDE